MVMKEPAGAIYKDLCIDDFFIFNVKLPLVLSKRSLIRSDSFQLKI
jgi:hypothetical protein